MVLITMCDYRVTQQIKNVIKDIEEYANQIDMKIQIDMKKFHNTFEGYVFFTSKEQNYFTRVATLLIIASQST